VWTAPVDGLHESVVQTLPSSTLSGLPDWQLPPLQTSPVVQALLSLQVVPFGFFASAGHVVVVPVQVSEASQSVAAARQTVPAGAVVCRHSPRLLPDPH
jgi:hypothetical protein